MVTDLVSDMLTRIRNAYIARHRYTVVPYSRLNWDITSVLKEEGFVKNFKLTIHENNKKSIFIDLKYEYIGRAKKPKPILNGIKRISKPGLRVYSGYKKLPIVLENLGIAIVSTSQGIMTNFRARQKQKGGEIICYVW